ncbi:MAG: FliH/SctL family protein [Leptospirillia bacterium]
MPSSSNRVLTLPPIGAAAPPVGTLPREPKPVVRPVEPVRTQERLMQIEREAYEAGFAAGERAGRETGEAEGRQVVEAISRIKDEVAQMRAQLVTDAERDILHLAVAVARQVVGYDIAEDHPVVVAGLAAATEHFAPGTPLQVRINPADRPLVAALEGELAAAIEGHMTLIPDPLIERGGVVVEGAGQIIDASLTTRFEEVVRSLFEAAA